MKKNNLFIPLIIAVVALLVLWLRENEMRVRAESRLSTTREKATSVINEKGEAINDLSTQLGEMQAKMQQASEENAAALNDKNEEIAKITEDARIAAAEQEVALQEKQKNVADLEAEIKEKTGEFDAALKKKNKELSEIGEQLRKATERLAGALKDKEKAESQNYDLAQEIAQSKKKLAKLAEDNRHLEALSKLAEQKTVLPDTAESTTKAA